jgi:hypothetical protein
MPTDLLTPIADFTNSTCSIEFVNAVLLNDTQIFYLAQQANTHLVNSSFTVLGGQ